MASSFAAPASTNNLGAVRLEETAHLPTPQEEKSPANSDDSDEDWGDWKSREGKSSMLKKHFAEAFDATCAGTLEEVKRRYRSLKKANFESTKTCFIEKYGSADLDLGREDHPLQRFFRSRPALAKVLKDEGAAIANLERIVAEGENHFFIPA